MGDVVRASGLVKAYGAGAARRRVLDGASLSVGAGELVAVIGPSGSGKSTLLHLLAGLDRLDAGTIEVAGVPVHRLGERSLTRLRRDQIGLVFQAFYLVPELTGAENVVLPARADGGGAAGAARARKLIERLGLGEAAARRPAELSGGEQQRLAIARALVNEPALVLADEPTGNLDDEAGAGVLSLLRAVATGGRAVVLVTHDPRAGAVADRMLRLADGRLQRMAPA
jgi:ABC-type lipoprotein export system ATPase subunit